MRRYAAPPLSSPQIYLGYIPQGYLGTQRTVEQIQALIREGAKDFYVRQKAIDILLDKAVKPKDYLGEIKALFEWVQDNIRYTKDPFRVEVLHSARRMLELRAGDCDDMTILLGAMLEAVGHPVRVVLTGSDPLRPRFFSHIYLEVYHKGRWISLDATMPYPMGWAPRTFVKKVIPIARKPQMKYPDLELQGIAATTTVPDWLREFIRAVRSGGLQPKDTRVKSLLDLLRQRQLLSRNQRLHSSLQFIWERGLSARPRPRTARWLVQQLRQLGILPTLPASSTPGQTAIAVRPVKPVGVVRPVQPVKVKPIASAVTQR
ncbi:MAG: transglutaminase-like domain-containing protein [Fischerella sp.]|nr:transglutaminase-like domain-containing protein [Fischerella sp.]